jgi:hypothetical protein
MVFCNLIRKQAPDVAQQRAGAAAPAKRPKFGALVDGTPAIILPVVDSCVWLLSFSPCQLSC